MAPSLLSVIDFSSKTLNPKSTSWATTCNEVTRALEEHGVFIAKYDGAPQEVEDAVFNSLPDLYNLPIEVKRLNCSDTHHGYIGQLPLLPLYESFGLQNPTTEEGVEKFTKLMWPSGNGTFRYVRVFLSSLELWMKEATACTAVAVQIEDFGCGRGEVVDPGKVKIVVNVSKVCHITHCRSDASMIAKSYEIEEEYESLHKSMVHVLGIQKYATPQGNDGSPVGIGPHTDKSFFTILRERQIGGLQIKTKDGDWIEVKPSPSSFIVIATDPFTAWTNGRIEGPCHRVIMKGDQERFSVSLFSFIKDLKIKTPQKLIDEEHPQLFKEFDHYKYVHYYMIEGNKSECPIKSYCGI
ncbi:hypothetical protein LXL04_016594 [Taraxacum kok-saghyz]